MKIMESGVGIKGFEPKKLVQIKSSGAVDFALRFVFLINSKFKIRTFNNYYESR
jgi:hypothetical protein